MEWQEIGVKTGAEAVEAVADAFFRLGAGGVVIEEPEVIRAMTESGCWDDYEFPEERLNRSYSLVTGYLPVNGGLPAKLEELRESLAEIARRLGKEPYEINIATVREEDWASSWKAFFKPVKLGSRLVVRPTWEEYAPSGEEIVVDIDPGMAFGTGSHITTILCARLLEKYTYPAMRVIDVGTGTGILAICAARLGAGEVVALDCDQTAVDTAAENVKKNRMEDVVKVEKCDLLSGLRTKADLVVANIIADVIVRLLPQVRTRLRPGGVFIASGITDERKDEVMDAAARYNYGLLEQKSQEGWTALVWRLKEC
ncbi:MAG: 50S ribosomal protein L11 methyltransferase [Peptococcaceae bacterium]|jgi:ribosomal protein L11 methyltransferase|nr:50S ribosomal protein L11 methyltransferase [Peptococcaceae bacterium]MDH7524509.1 50S ribosomal protein L11 methyltransferase [Peptococcaceae bacterium]